MKPVSSRFHSAKYQLSETSKKLDPPNKTLVKGGGEKSAHNFHFIKAPPSKASPNYEFIPGMGYYKLHTTTKSWLDARNICAEEGAHLAIINSEKELRALQGIFQLHPKIRDGWENNVAYIGFHDLFTEGQYVTIFGDPLASTGYSTFASGQPTDKNGSTGEDCGCMDRLTGLHDVGCNQLMPFFCEQEIF
uniref:C-type lectin domain-containing protein n=1 Tax=Timema bartmani TaxID=61472 RepID=A0A7R9FA83_9NEOP|nr:unnamed protein product [Timema bartmani]